MKDTLKKLKNRNKDLKSSRYQRKLQMPNTREHGITDTMEMQAQWRLAATGYMLLSIRSRAFAADCHQLTGLQQLRFCGLQLTFANCGPSSLMAVMSHGLLWFGWCRIISYVRLFGWLSGSVVLTLFVYRCLQVFKFFLVPAKRGSGVFKITNCFSRDSLVWFNLCIT